MPRFSGLAWRRARWGYVFIAPWIIGFFAFTLFPMVAALALKFTNINLQQADHLRYVVPFVAGVLIWGGMLNQDSGWINGFLEAIGIAHPPAWLEDPSWISAGFVIMGVWGIGAGMIVYRAGLKGIPTDLYEAAKIDGAGAWASLRNITIPMISPVIFYTIVLAVVEVLQYFLVPLVLKGGTGEPGGSTNFFNLYLYKNFFTYQNMSYGAPLAWLLFAITLAITLILFGTARRWVYYAGEAR